MTMQGRRSVLRMGFALALLPLAGPGLAQAYQLSEGEWRRKLSPAAYRVLRQEATEIPFSSSLDKEKGVGIFRCAGCGQPLFRSTAKFNSGTGWPSFTAALPGAVDLRKEGGFLGRVEVRCARCLGHLGHVFDDGPRPTGKRFCMNGVALRFQAAG